MKRICALILVFLMLFSFSIVAQENDAADDDDTDETEDETQDETEDESEDETEDESEEESEDETEDESEDETEDESEEESEDETEDESEDETEDESEEESEEESEDESEDETEDESEDDDEVVDDETEEEIELFADKPGAQLRIYQLQRTILKAVITATAVADYVDGMEGVDSEHLLDLIAEMEDVYDQVGAIDPASDLAVEDFVHYKKDAKDLAKEFRDELKGKLTSNDRQAIHDAVKAAIDASEELDALHEQIRNQNQELNAERLQNALRKMGVEDDDLVEKVRSGDATGQEVKDKLREGYDGLTPEEKRVARQKIKAEVKKKVELKREVVTKVTSERAERVKQELKERIERMPEDRKERVKETINNRIEKLDQAKERMNERIDNAQERMEQDRERVNERIDNAQERLNERIEQRQENLEDIRGDEE